MSRSQEDITALVRLYENVGGSKSNPSDAAAVLVNVGDLRRILRLLARLSEGEKVPQPPNETEYREAGLRYDGNVEYR